MKSYEITLSVCSECGGSGELDYAESWQERDIRECPSCRGRGL